MDNDNTTTIICFVLGALILIIRAISGSSLGAMRDNLSYGFSWYTIGFLLICTGFYSILKENKEEDFSNRASIENYGN